MNSPKRNAFGRMKPVWALLVFVIGLALLNSFNQYQPTSVTDEQSSDFPGLHSAEGIAGSDMLFAEAFRKQQSNIQLSGAGKIKKVLKDDKKGSRHQRILVELEIGQTLLIAHNIDLAPRIENLRQGEEIEFFGEYEWNQKGGVIHWTHHDPKGKHPDGWIKYQGRVYR